MCLARDGRRGGVAAGLVAERARELVDLARRYGYGRGELIEIIQRVA